MDKIDSLSGSSTLQVCIDGQPIHLPNWLADSMPSIKTYLECIAMKRKRVLWSLQVDGIKLDLTDDLLMNAYSSVRAQTISYDELSERLLSAGRTKVQELLSTIEHLSLTVLINDHTLAQQLWYGWELQLHEPLFGLRAFHELQQLQKFEIPDAHLLPGHLDQLSFLNAEVESLFRSNADDSAEMDIVAFSEIIDYTLLPWLRSLDLVFENAQREFFAARS